MPSLEKKDSVADKIFNHLQMFQFYQELKYYDQTLVGGFMGGLIQHSFSASEELNVQFLRDWDKKCDKSNTTDWDLTGKTISRSKFAKQFEQFSPEGIEFGGGPGILSKFRVSNIPIIYFNVVLQLASKII